MILGTPVTRCSFAIKVQINALVKVKFYRISFDVLRAKKTIIISVAMDTCMKNVQ